jgi:hypothetical protein
MDELGLQQVANGIRVSNGRIWALGAQGSSSCLQANNVSPYQFTFLSFMSVVLFVAEESFTPDAGAEVQRWRSCRNAAGMCEQGCMREGKAA